MPPIDTSSWPTKDDARRELGGLSLSQLNNLIKAKRLEVRLRKRQGKPPIGVVNPTDLEREASLRAEAESRPHILPPEVPAPAAMVPAVPAPGRKVPDRRLRILAATPVPLWLTTAEAIAYSGLSGSHVRDIARKGVVKMARGPRGIVFCRADIEKYSSAW